MSRIFTDQLYEKADRLFLDYPRKVHALLPLLHLVQKEKGWLSPDSMKEVAGMCDVAVSHVQGVVTFYTMYAQEPRGKCGIGVCTNLSCYLRGGVEILEFLEGELDVAPGESTSDGRFFLEEVECLGACGYAPVVMVGERYHEKVTKEELGEVIRSNR